MREMLLIVGSLLAALRPAVAGEVTVAVASNFLHVAQKIAADFERQSEHTVVLSHGATGQLYAQIVNGAPFDIFLSADTERPANLRSEARTRAVRTYALGRLVLVSRVKITAEDAAEVMQGRNVALADPILAPYGLAATAAMERLNLDTATFQPLPVANVAQAATLFQTGNADVAFVAASLVASLDARHELPLDGLHPPIRQDAALLARAADDEAALEFWEYLFSEPARPRIRGGGYALPE